MSVLWIVIVVVVILALLGFFDRGWWGTPRGSSVTIAGVAPPNLHGARATVAANVSLAATTRKETG
jgi:hypothetical protein